MSPDNFLQQKQDILSKNDKSSKESIDEKITKLCNKINKKENYYTTSSCAGRILIMIDEVRKQGGLFLKVHHDKISLRKLKEDLEKIRSLNTRKSNGSKLTLSSFSTITKLLTEKSSEADFVVINRARASKFVL